MKTCVASSADLIASQRKCTQGLAKRSRKYTHAFESNPLTSAFGQGLTLDFAFSKTHVSQKTKFVLFLSLPVLLVLVCIKRDLWKRLIRSSYEEGLFEQEERFNRRKKHNKNQSTKAQKFSEKYHLNDSSMAFLHSP